MGILRHRASGQEVPLAGGTTIGRAPHCAVRLRTPVASADHARLTWMGGAWTLRDLGSRNGTWVDGARVAAGSAVILGAGARLGFGDPDDLWELRDASGPCFVATELTSGERLAAADLVCLPSEAAPLATAYLDAAGTWVVEIGDRVRPLVDQEVLQVGGGSWRVALPLAHEGTPLVEARPSLPGIGLVLRVSRDEEHVQLAYTWQGRTHALEAREHHYVTLTLARVRLADAALPDEERGWVDRLELQRMTGLDAGALNVAIHRARRQLLDAGVEGAAALVEVRRGQRRIGVARHSVLPG